MGKFQWLHHVDLFARTALTAHQTHNTHTQQKITQNIPRNNNVESQNNRLRGESFKFRMSNHTKIKMTHKTIYNVIRIGRENSPFEGNHSIIRPCAPNPLPHGAPICHSPPKIPLPCGQGKVSELSEQANHHAGKRQRL